MARTGRVSVLADRSPPARRARSIRQHRSATLPMRTRKGRLAIERGKMSTKSDAKKTMAVLGDHVKELVGHTLDSAAYGGHGHAAGKQGRAGHRMPFNDAHLHIGAYVPQNMYTSGSSRRTCLMRGITAEWTSSTTENSRSSSPRGDCRERNTRGPGLQRAR